MSPQAPKLVELHLPNHTSATLGQMVALGALRREHNSMGFVFVWAFIPVDIFGFVNFCFF